MESQHFAVHHQNLTPIDEDGGFVMKFSIDVVEDVPAEVENVMHLATVGLFAEAREAAASTMERYLDSFPILIEFLRLLYDQGDYLSLRDHVQTAKKSKIKWDDEQILLLSLFEDLTLVQSEGYSHHAFQRIKLRTLVVQDFKSTALEAMSEEQILAISLMIRLEYLRYQYRGAITATNFVLWSTKKTENAPFAFFEHLLQQENYWAAVNALEVCLRKAKNHFHTLNFTRLWEAIEPLATTCCADDPEEVLWATTDLLQTFCEGLLRRTATQIKPWGSAITFLSNMPQIIEAKCETKYAWSNSRSFRRQELIELDKAVLTRNQSRDLEIDEATAGRLSRVSDHAQEHQDVRLRYEIRWRIGVLIQGIDPTKIPPPPGNIPLKIYEKRHKLILQANKTSKNGWFRSSLGVLWETLREKTARGQEPPNQSPSPRTMLPNVIVPSTRMPDITSFKLTRRRLQHSSTEHRKKDSRMTVIKLPVSKQIQDQFFAPSRPFLPGLAVFICLLGAMDLFPRQQHHPSIFEEKVESVNSLYGPGTLLSWILAAVSLLYDADSSQSTFAFDGADWITWAGDWLKYAALWFLGLWALIEAIVRALHQDFGPSYAAALYVSDKAFEVATLYYCVKTFGIHRRDKAKRDKAADKKPEEAETGRLSVESRRRADKTYTVAPCVIMIVLWLLCRALSNGHPVYSINDHVNPVLPVSWKPLLPWYWKLILVVPCFACTCLMGYLVDLGWWSWGFPTGALASFTMLHSGLFGTLGIFRLTTSKMSDSDQLFQLVFTVVTLIILYGLRLGESLRKRKDCM